MSDIAERFSTGGWEFTPDVVAVFDEHVRASVPHYDLIQNLVCAATDWLLPDGGVLADFGAATGTTAASVYARHPQRVFDAYLYDDQPAMLDTARARLSGLLGDRLHLSGARIESGYLEHKDADLTTVLFTLQFLPPADRVLALRLAHQRSKPSGALLVAEKVLPADARWAEIANDLSHDWKAEHGISDTAIRAKARALRGVLRPLSATACMGLVESAGWVDTEVIFRWHNWMLLGAFASHAGS